MNGHIVGENVKVLWMILRDVRHVDCCGIGRSKVCWICVSWRIVFKFVQSF